MAAFNYGGINFREAGSEYVSPEEGFGIGSQEIRAEYLTAWSDRQAARVALLGYTKINSRSMAGGGQQITYLQRYLPHQYPDPMGSWLYCSRVPRIRGDGTPLGKDANGVMSYSDARVTAVYTDLPYEILSDDQIANPALGGAPDEAQLYRYIIYSAREKEKQLTWRAGSWLFTDTKTYVGSALARSFVVTELEWIWVGVPYAALPAQAILNGVGKVNSVTFNNCQPGTLLFRGPIWEKTRMPEGTRAMNIHVRADFNPYTWNSAPDPLRGNQFFPIASKDGTQTPYGTVDPNTFFRPSLTG